jgi:hypothetical protein
MLYFLFLLVFCPSDKFDVLLKIARKMSKQHIKYLQSVIGLKVWIKQFLELGWWLTIKKNNNSNNKS